MNVNCNFNFISQLPKEVPYFGKTTDGGGSEDVWHLSYFLQNRKTPRRKENTTGRIMVFVFYGDNDSATNYDDAVVGPIRKEG